MAFAVRDHFTAEAVATRRRTDKELSKRAPLCLLPTMGIHFANTHTQNQLRRFRSTRGRRQECGKQPEEINVCEEQRNGGKYIKIDVGLMV